MGRISAPLNMASTGGGHHQLTTSADALRALFRSHYQKLVNDYPYPEYPGKDKDTSPIFVAPAQCPPHGTHGTPPATEEGGSGERGASEALTYNCRHCGHSDKLQVKVRNNAGVIGTTASTACDPWEPWSHGVRAPP